MQSFAFFIALLATANAKLLGDGAFKMKFSSVKEEAEKFSHKCREELNEEGPTFTIDVSDHTLGKGVGE